MANYLPLSGRSILLTRSANQLGSSKKLFESFGANVFELPALIIGPPDEFGHLDGALDELDTFHWIIFSSVNGVNAVEQRLALKNMSLKDKKKHLKIAAVGRKTSDFLKQLDIAIDFVPPDFNADSLITHFPVSGAGLKMLIPRVQSGGRTVLAEAFASSGSHVVEVAAYETSCPKTIPQITIDAFNENKIDAITFTSSKIVSHCYTLLKRYFGEELEFKLGEIKLLSIGPQTTKSCQKYFKRVDIEAIPHDMNGLIKACIKIF
ncbi:uroporphyrinogen-III synthase [Prochlorococcus sp. MIT 1223]|uniref:uroporphyrinogen-III synthase n=1 Tax=Prochlorococcus sp. MIT 1223 TaxID=3096217 RepID=UPI002A74D5BC|nr:uroporphyrinogen-III synthase [Prochlorococcus sp. MIT 1223]